MISKLNWENRDFLLEKLNIRSISVTIKRKGTRVLGRLMLGKLIILFPLRIIFLILRQFGPK